jgi:hypothetical protein
MVHLKKKKRNGPPITGILPFSMRGIAFYFGNIEEWKNDLMIGCLSREKIIRLVIKDNKVIGEQ